MNALVGIDFVISIALVIAVLKQIGQSDKKRCTFYHRRPLLHLTYLSNIAACSYACLAFSWSSKCVRATEK